MWTSPSRPCSTSATLLLALHTCAAVESDPGRQRSCQVGYYQHEPVALGCDGGHIDKQIHLAPSTPSKRAFAWVAPAGTQNLSVAVQLSLMDGNEAPSGAVALDATCDGDERALVGAAGSVLNGSRVEASFQSAIWSWSGGSKGGRQWIRVAGVVSCELQVSLANLRSGALEGAFRASWDAVEPCPIEIRGCEPCPRHACRSGEEAACDGSSYWECKPVGSAASEAPPGTTTPSDEPHVATISQQAAAAPATTSRRAAPATAAAAGAAAEDADTSSTLAEEAIIDEDIFQSPADDIVDDAGLEIGAESHESSPALQEGLETEPPILGDDDAPPPILGIDGAAAAPEIRPTSTERSGESHQDQEEPASEPSMMTILQSRRVRGYQGGTSNSAAMPEDLSKWRITAGIFLVTGAFVAGAVAIAFLSIFVGLRQEAQHQARHRERQEGWHRRSPPSAHHHHESNEDPSDEAVQEVPSGDYAPLCSA